VQFHKARLDNGLQIVAELNPNAQSLAVGFFVRTGSRDETSDVSGVSHFLEHMAFKGDEKFSADDVNRIFDEVGAKYNASTSEEVTLYYAAILPEYFAQTFEILAGLLYPTLRVDDFAMEKKVILEEIGMYEDQPAFTAYEQTMQLHFNGHPLGRSILGSKNSIEALTSDQMRAYHAQQYKAGNVVLAIAGKAEWPEILELAEQYCNRWPAGQTDRPTDEAQPTGGLSVLTKEGSVQQHVMRMAPAPTAASPLRFAAELLSVIVGDDSGSRLYWELVDPGLAEAAEIGYNEYDGSGTWLTYLSCNPESTAENLERIDAIYQGVDPAKPGGVSEEELEIAKSKVASRVVLRSERPMGRLGSLGSNWLYRREYRSVEDDLNVLSSMTIDHIRELLDAYPLGHVSTVTVGPLTELVVS